MNKFEEKIFKWLEEASFIKLMSIIVIFSIILIGPFSYYFHGKYSLDFLVSGICVTLITAFIFVRLFYRHQHYLIDAKKNAEAANVSKSLFLANISHDIRTPLSSIVGFSALLGDTPLNLEQSDYLTNIARSSEVLIKLIADVSTLARIESDAFSVERQLFSIREVISRVTETTHINIQQSGKKIVFSSHIDSNVPEYMLGSPIHIEQVVNNFISNAVKFTEAGKIELNLDKSPAGQMLFSVRDTGVGITKEKLAQIFEPLSQSDVGKRSLGMGLGLSLCKQRVEKMGGTIGVESGIGYIHGSRFFFEIPCIEAPKADLIKATSDPSEVMQPTRPLDILVAEDNPANRLLVAKMLQRVHHRVLLANDGEQAVQQWRDHAALDVILMDMQMPNVSGLEAIQQIRALEQKQGRRRIPIIVLSATELTVDVNRPMKLDCDDYLVKPIDRKVLFDSIAKHTRAKP